MFARAAWILCVAFSFVEGWKFGKHHTGPDDAEGGAEKKPMIIAALHEAAALAWRFEGDDGNWEEPVDLRKKKYSSEENCYADSPQTELTTKELMMRNKIINKARPWKVPTTKDAGKIASGVAPTDIHTLYYFNAEADTAKQHFMNLQLRAKVSPEVNIERWPLADITDVDDDAIQNELSTYSDDTLAEYVRDLPEKHQLQVVSSYLSTMRLLRQIQSRAPKASELFVITEDDVQLSPDWEEELLGHMKHLPQDWDVARFVYWGAKRCQDLVPVNGKKSPWYEARGWKAPEDDEPKGLLSFGAPKKDEAKLSQPLKNNKAWYAGNQAYVIRAGSIPDILAQAKALPVMHIEGVFSSGHQEGMRKFDAFDVPWTWGIHSYALSKPLGHQVDHEEVERHDRPTLGTEF